MPLAIKKGGLTLPGELYVMTSELAHRRGLEPAEALREALEDALARTPAAEPADADSDVRDALAIAARIRTHLLPDTRTEDDILGYPEMFPDLYSRK
jgi:hypothetical protein